jgi:hypothetical protein
MGVRTFAAAVLFVSVAAWASGSPQREKPLWPASSSGVVRDLEAAVAAHAGDAAAVDALAHAYVDAFQPGLAVRLVERSSAQVRDDVRVRHTFAWALLHEGRSQEALAVEGSVVAACRPLADGQGAQPGCDPLLLATASRRVDILRELVSLGVQDAQAHPEETLVAYQNATREARVTVQ